MSAEKYLSPKDIAAALSVSRSMGYQVARQCEHVKVGRVVRVPESSFKRWLAEHTLAPDVPRSETVGHQAARIGARAAALARRKAAKLAARAAPAQSLIKLTRPRT